MSRILYFMVIVFLSSCSQGTLHIAYLGSFTGNDSPLGNSARDGAVLAIEEINKIGGVKNTKLILDFFDDKSTPGEAAILVKKIIEKNFPLMIGPFSTGRAIEILPLINQAKILTLGPVVAGVQLSNSDDYFFRLYPSTMDFGRGLGRTIIDYGYTNPSVIMDMTNTGFAEPVYSGIQEKLGPGNLKVNTVSFRSKDNPDYFSLAKETLAQNPDVVVVVAPSNVLTLFAQNIKKLNSQIPLLTTPYGMDQGLLLNGGGAVEGLLGEIPYDLDSSSPIFLEFIEKFRNRFGKMPTHAALANWEAVNILIEGLKLSEIWTSERVKEAILKKRQFEGLQGTIEIDMNGDANRNLSLYKVSKGKFIKQR